MSFGNASEQGRPVAIKDEGLTIVTSVGSIDFTGAGVSGSAIGSDVTETIGGGGGAPTDATYITQTPSGSLSAEQALSTLATGYVKNTTGTGVLSIQSTPIPIADGGSGQITANAALNAFLPDQTGNSGKFLKTNATDTSWDTITLASADFVNQGTTTTVLHGNAAGSPSWSAVSLTADVSGVLPVANGGTATSTAFTIGSIVFAGASGVYSQDNANLFWDNTNNYLGIQNITPKAHIDVGSTYPFIIGSGTSFNGGVGFSFNAYFDGSWKRKTANPASLITMNDGGFVGDISYYQAGTSSAGSTIAWTTPTLYLKSSNQNVGFGITSPTANIHIKASTGVANSAPLKFTSGTLLGTAETGAMEFLTNKYYATITTGAARKEIALNEAALTTGSILFANSSGRIAQDNSNIFWDDTNNFLGIGNTNPVMQLDIGSTYPFLIGSGTPFNGGVGFTFNAYYSSGWKRKTTNPVSLISMNDGGFVGDISYYHGASGAAGSSITFTDATLYLKNTSTASTSSGRVGVGTTSPTAHLHIKAGTASSSTAPLKFTTGTDLTVAEAGAMEFGSSRLAFTPSGTTRKRVALTNDATPTNGQIPIGNGTDYTVAAITAGTGINVTNGAGSITITNTSTGITWTEVTGTSQQAAVNNGYIANNAGLVTITLPDTAAVGDVVEIVGKGAGLWKLAQNASEIIHFLSSDTTTGVGGSLAATVRYDCVKVICTVANTEWVVSSVVGNLTVT